MKATCLFVMLGALIVSSMACAAESQNAGRPAKAAEERKLAKSRKTLDEQIEAQKTAESRKAPEEQQAAQKSSLYDRLGGQTGIIAVVDTFVARVGADDRINSYFENTDLPKLKERLVEQICQASGGPCKYNGRSMKETHKGMGITGDHFDALVADLTAALDTHRVPSRDKTELLSALAPMRNDIVEKP
jgi:hemoglobin